MDVSLRPAFDPIAGALALHRPYLMQFARRRLFDSALAEDAVQDTLLAAWQGAASFERRSALRTWLTGILRHRIADAVRAAGRNGHGARSAAGDDEREAPSVEDDDTTPGPGNEPVDWVDPPRRLEGWQLLGTVSELLDGLPEQAAELFELRMLDGLSNEQAAHALGIDARRATVLMHRTLSRLRDGLSDQADAASRPASEPATTGF